MERSGGGALSGAPALSVILATPDDYNSLRLTMRYLRAQTARAEIEIVIVGPSDGDIHPPDEALSGFWGHQIVSQTDVTSVGRANAAGIRRARAPLVALAEDHCFPEPGWAAALILAHRGPWAVVGPALRNANPATMVSWSDFVIGYGPWMHPVAPATVTLLPGHNSSYKRSVLLEYGPGLEAMMESESVLHMELSKRGHRLYLEPEARTAHTNFALPSSWFRAQFYAGRVFGFSRATSWGLGKRLFYAAASPLIPLVRLWRCGRELAKPGRPLSLLPRMFPYLLLGLILDGLGQMTGYLFGAGDSVSQMAPYEFHRFQHVPESDRRAAEEMAPA